MNTPSYNDTENGQILVWTVQPDGRYWADDDGFDMDDEINLYAYVDDDGDFLSKFRIYDIGNINFLELIKRNKPCVNYLMRMTNA